MRFQTNTTVPFPTPSVAAFQQANGIPPSTYSASSPSGSSLQVTEPGDIELISMLLSWTSLEIAGLLQVGNLMTVHQCESGGSVPMAFNPPLKVHTDDGLWIMNNSHGGSYSVFLYYKELP